MARSAPRRTATKPARKTAAPKTAAKPKTDPKLQAYADKPPTDLHKAFARFCVEVIGFVPEDMPTKRAAFLKGVSLAMAARQHFQGSDWLAEWREENNVTKVGRKPKDEEDIEDDDELAEEDLDDASDEDADDEVDLDALEEELNSLAIGKLRAAAKEYGVTLTQGMKKAEIVDAILDSVEEEGEEGDEDEDEELDLEALEAEMEEMELPDLKAFVKEEFDIAPKPRERKGPLIQRVIDLLAEEEEAAEEDEDEEETPPPAKSRARKAAPAGKASKKDDDLLF